MSRRHTKYENIIRNRQYILNQLDVEQWQDNATWPFEPILAIHNLTNMRTMNAYMMLPIKM